MGRSRAGIYKITRSVRYSVRGRETPRYTLSVPPEIGQRMLGVQFVCTLGDDGAIVFTPLPVGRWKRDEA